MLNTVLALALAATTSAAPTRDILGLQIGAPLPFPECPFREQPAYRSYPAQKFYRISGSVGKPCWEHAFLDKRIGLGIDPEFEEVELQLWNTPDGLMGRVAVTTIHGRVEAVSLKTLGENYQESIFSLLSNKYGKPWTISRDQVQNLMGAEFTSLVAIWKFSDMEVSFLGLSKAGQGSLSVQSTVALARVANIKRAREEAAIKL